MGASSFWLRQRTKRYEPRINPRRRPVLLDGNKFRLRNLFGKPSVSQPLLKVSS